MSVIAARRCSHDLVPSPGSCLNCAFQTKERTAAVGADLSGSRALSTIEC